ncbi:hypothetical protein [Blastococcus sp. PRF04-17]|uniref:hypothetical protein n=1 Tax=Blastococcus sp. PRF04-17 TaxID=2933797 RepID=UPI001FF6242E|nr:hypothetical protein [Blastococcus sp. PRF04-17]UOY02414.1 hypothetical protein MVA48_03225 [Blastococcus sp. PRF04-17]
MRARQIATTVAAVTAGVTAAVALHRRADRRLPGRVPTPASLPAVAPVLDREGVVLPFVRPAAPAAPEVEAVRETAAPARCGDTGGRTKSGAPCGARATSGGRCHHHPIAA